MDRLSPLDASFLYFEDRDTPMHVGSVAVFHAPAEGFDYERLVALIRDRIAFVPRYRQRIRPVPGRIAGYREMPSGRTPELKDYTVIDQALRTTDSMVIMVLDNRIMSHIGH